MVIPLLANPDLKPMLYQGVEEAKSSKNWSNLEKRLAKNKKLGISIVCITQQTKGTSHIIRPNLK